jgi:hypothetical protein
MGISRFVKGILIFVAVSVFLAAPASAIDGALDLPSTMVRIEVSYGTQSYFDTVLSEVPSGYDVTNATYRGWCVDVRTEMALSPATHAVFLYSSTSPPGELANEAWDLINYILNHEQGSVLDVQQAIWYFMYIDGDGEYVPSNIVAWMIINDTLENGSGFIPGPGQVTAVICYPTILFPNQPDVQISIIEVESNTVVPEFPSALVLTPIMLTVTLAVLVHTKRRKAPANRLRAQVK